MFQYEKGVILIVILIFLSLISLLVMMSAEIGALEKRMSINLLSSSQNMMSAFSGLKKGEDDLKSGLVFCEIPIISTNDFMAKSTAWWHSSETCHGEFSGHQYQYVVERLGEDPCAIISDQQGAQFWRITSRSEHGKQYGATIVLQATVAIPFNSVQKCSEETRRLSDSWQSWRVIN